MLALLLAFAGPADDLHHSLAGLAREQALRVLSKPVAVKAAGFEGTVTAVEPAKNLTIRVGGVALTGDVFTTETQIGGVFDLAGKMKIGETPTDIKTRIRVKVTAAGRAGLTYEKGEFLVRGGADEVELTDVEVLSFEPDILPGGKGLLGGLIKGLIKTNKADISKRIAEKLEPVKLPTPAAVSGPAPGGDNPVLRRYAQSVILSELVKHDSPRAGVTLEERGEGVVARGTAWLDSPGKLTKVVVTRFTLHDGVVHVGGAVRGPVVGTARFDVPPGVSIESGFRANLALGIEADLRFKGGKPAGCNVYQLGGLVTEFQATALPVRLVRNAAEALLNRVLEVKSLEYRPKIEQAGGGAARSELVTAAYRRAFGRDPDPAGMKASADALSHLSPRDLFGGLIAAPEFADRNVKGKTRGEVTAVLYDLILGREPKGAELSYLAGKETVYEERRVRLRIVRVAVGQRARTYKDLAAALLAGKEYLARFGAGLPR